MFCPYCGKKVEDGEIHNCPNKPVNNPNRTAQAVRPQVQQVRTAVNPIMNGNPVQAAIKELAGSGAALVLLILLAVPVLISFISSVTIAIKYQIISTLLSSFVSFAWAMLTVLGLGLIWSSAKNRNNPSVNGGGFTCLQVVQIVKLVGVCLGVLGWLALLILGIVLIQSAGSYSGSYGYSSNTGNAIIGFIVLMIFAGLSVILSLFIQIAIVRSIASAKNAALRGVYKPKVSAFLGVMTIIGIIGSVIGFIAKLILLATQSNIINYIYEIMNELLYEVQMMSGEQIPYDVVQPIYGLVNSIFANSWISLISDVMGIAASVVVVMLIFKARRYLKLASMQPVPVVNNTYRAPERRPAPQKIAEEPVRFDPPAPVVPEKNDYDFSDIFSTEEKPEDAPVFACLTSLKNGTDTAITKDVLKIGKNVAICDLVVANPNVSGLHAVIEYADGKYILSDNASTNGTYLNGTLINESVELSNGDTILFADEAYTFNLNA